MLLTFCIRVLKILIAQGRVFCLSSTIITRLSSNALDRTFAVVHGAAPHFRFIDKGRDDGDDDQNRAKTRAPIQGALT